MKTVAIIIGAVALQAFVGVLGLNIMIQYRESAPLGIIMVVGATYGLARTIRYIA
jgi:hypothetical protein